MMDDWPSTISRRGPFKRFWERKIDSELKQLLEITSLALGISDSMSAEYFRRYNKAFKPYHNPIDISIWKPYTKSSCAIRDDKITVLYSGRIGRGITQSLMELANVVEGLNAGGMDIKLHIQTTSVKNEILQLLSKSSNVIVNPVADYSDLPTIYSGADILVIVNDFDEESVNFLRYSMPTKASEFMISGTPILVYSHFDTAISKFFKENSCGYCVSDHDLVKLSEAIMFIVNNEEYRAMLSRNAVKLAASMFDSRKVRLSFQSDIINVVSHHQN